MRLLPLVSFLFIGQLLFGQKAAGRVNNQDKIVYAQTLFGEKKYKASARQWKILAVRLPQDQLVLFNAGISTFYAGETNESLEFFRQVAEGKKSLYVPALYWMSKIYGRQNKRIAAVTTLGIALTQDNIPLGVYHQLLDLAEKFSPWEEEFKQRAEDEVTNEDRLHLGLQFYRLAWILNPIDSYKEQLYDLYLKLGDEAQALRTWNTIKSERIKLRLKKLLKNYRQKITDKKFKEKKSWRPGLIEFGVTTRYMSDSNPRTAVKNTNLTINSGERMVANLDMGINYSRRFDQINQVKISFLADQINNDVESRFREYKISLPFRALSKTSEGVVTPSYSDSSYGHYSYQRFYSLDAHYTKFFRRYRTFLGLAYRKANASSLKLNHQDGDIYEAEIGLGRSTSHTNMRALLSYRIDNMTDTPGAAWSNDMKALELNISRQMFNYFVFHGNYRISETRFAATASGERKDLLQRFEGSVELPLLDVLSFKWFYRYEDNRADGTALNDFTYDRHLIGMEITGRVE